MQRVCKNMTGYFYFKMARNDSSFEPYTDFQKWLQPAMERRGVDVADVARAVGSDYPHIWKLAKGDPKKYPSSKRPGFELTRSIGEYLQDVQGALIAAKYEEPAPNGEKKVNLTRTVAPDSIKVLDAYEGLPEPLRRSAREHLENLQRVANEAYKKRTDIVGKTTDDDELTRISVDDE